MDLFEILRKRSVIYSGYIIVDQNQVFHLLYSLQIILAYVIDLSFRKVQRRDVRKVKQRVLWYFIEFVVGKTQDNYGTQTSKRSLRY